MSVANKILQAAAGNAGGDATYVEDVFSTYVYEGTGLNHTINNGMNLGSLNVNAFAYSDDSTAATVVLDHLAEGDVVVVFNTAASGSTNATVTVGGSSATVLEQDFSWPTYSYLQSTFAYTVASGDPALMEVVITNNTYGGLVLVIKGGATVTLQAGASSNSTNTITEPDFSTTGYGLILTSDRDPGAKALTTTDADLTNLIIDDSPSFFVHSCWEMDSGNGGTISGFNDGSNYPQVHVVLKVEGAGTTAFGNTEADGGMVWIKSRSGTQSNEIADTERGRTKFLRTNSNGLERTSTSHDITSFNAAGFNVSKSVTAGVGSDGSTYCSWTFRKAEKFFDIVTYTGNGTAGTEIAHNLKSTPGMIVVKALGPTYGGSWRVWHRSISTSVLRLDQTAGISAIGAPQNTWGDNSSVIQPTSTHFTIGSDTDVNRSSTEYIAYIFAHDEQEFGEDSDEAIIKCGSYTGNGSAANGPEIDLGFEPQWLLIKKAGAGTNGNWLIYDSMRGIATGTNDYHLIPNTTAAESNDDRVDLTATGFKITSTSYEVNTSSSDYIYMAIRRPHKPASELSARELFAIDTKGGTKPNPPLFTFGLPVDMAFNKNVNGTGSWRNVARLMQGKNLVPNRTKVQTRDGS